MNTGAEAVETAIKITRRWAYKVKGIPENKAKIIVCENNFHGRTTTIISFSNDPTARKHLVPIPMVSSKFHMITTMLCRECT